MRNRTSAVPERAESVDSSHVPPATAPPISSDPANPLEMRALADRLEELDRAATHGPWFVDWADGAMIRPTDASVGVIWGPDGDQLAILEGSIGHMPEATTGEDDARLLVELRNNLPAILLALRNGGS